VVGVVSEKVRRNEVGAAGGKTRRGSGSGGSRRLENLCWPIRRFCTFRDSSSGYRWGSVSLRKRFLMSAARVLPGAVKTTRNNEDVRKQIPGATIGHRV
jgi:hypothetical protein